MAIERIETAPRLGMSDRTLGERARVHAALGDTHRLAIVDELALSDRSPTELGATLEIGSNLLAHHLDVLEHAGLVRREVSAGDQRRKYVRLSREALAWIWEPATTVVARRLLFVCTGNSARSQLAAALWNAEHDIPAESAGTRPAQQVHPEAIRVAGRAGLDLRGARPRSLDEVLGEPDLVVTVCDRAHEQLGSARPGERLHWSIPDPVDAGVPSAFDDALTRLSERVNVLAARVARGSPVATARRPRGRSTRP
jgi:protein-tyrosine-phosphatase/DNA-binding HxlR family transcriptional regulator